MRWFRVRALLAAGALALSGCRASQAHAPAATQTSSVLLVADIHFDPFANPAIVPRLLAAPPAQWDAVFASGANPRESGYKVDTNRTLLGTSLDAMRADAPSPRLVVIAGDFLAHGFRSKFEQTSKRRDRASYDRFVDATIAYLALAFDRQYPHAQFVITVGNNDNDCDDYQSTPHSAFLRHWAKSWEPLVNRDGAAPGFAATFPIGGWYDASLPFARTRVLVPNSVYWSTGFHNACGDPHEPIGEEQQAALAKLLAARPASTHWWLLTHVPPGIDTFASLRGLGLKTMYRPRWLRAFLALRTTSGRAFDLIVAGHTHMNDFRLAPSAGGRGVAPIMLLPSITRFGGNDPAFLVANVTRDGAVADYTAYHDSAKFFGLGARLWSSEYRFDDAFGERGVDAAAFARIQSRLGSDELLRDRFYGEWYASGSLLGLVIRTAWHRTWCGQAELTPSAYLRCRGKA